MPLFDLQVIASLMTPTKQIECGDRRLERAEALFEEHLAEMNPHDRILAESLLTYSRELKVGFEAKCLPNQIKQARMYCSHADKTLQKIQAVVEKDTDVRAMDLKSADDGDGFIFVG